jgi:hypothetical protein
MLIGINTNHYARWEGKVIFGHTEADEAAKADGKGPNGHRREGLV